MRMIRRCFAGAFYALSLCSASLAGEAQPEPATATAPAPAEEAALAPNILAPPGGDESLSERIESVRAEIRRLRERWNISTQPASAPASAPAPDSSRAVAQSLYETLNLYLSELRKWQTTRHGIAELKSSAGISRLSSQLKTWDELLATIREESAHDPRSVSEERLAEITAQYEKLNATLTELTARQSARDQQLAGFAKLLTEANAQSRETLEKLKRYSAGLPAMLDAARTEGEREALLLRKRLSDWGHNLQLLRAAAYPDQRTLLELEKQYDADRVAHLGPCVKAVHELQQRLTRAQAQSEAEYAADQLARPDLPEYLHLYWTMVQLSAEAARYFQGLDDPTGAPFTRDEHEQISARIKRADTTWPDFIATLHRRPGGTILKAYRFVNERLREEEELLARLKKELAASGERQREIMEKRDLTLWDLREKRNRFDALVQKLSGDALQEAKELQTRLTAEVRPELEKKINTVTRQQTELEERLVDAVAHLEEYIEKLQGYRSLLYWRRLLIQGPGLLRQDRTAMSLELRAVRAWRGPDVQRITAMGEDVRRELAATPAEKWVSLGAVLIMSGWLARLTRRRLLAWIQLQPELRKPVEPAPEGETPTQPIQPRRITSRRAQIQSARVVARTALLTWPLMILPAAGYAMSIVPAALPFVLVGVAAIVGGRLAFAAISALLDPRRPHLRIIPANDQAARYHARWLRFLVLYGAVTIPPLVALGLMNVFPELRNTVRAWSQTLLLVLLLVYSLRRRMFLPRRGGSWTFVKPLLRITSALLSIGCIALVVLQFAGYIALVDYVLRAVALTLVVVALATVLRSLLHVWTAEHAEQENPASGSSASQSAAPAVHRVHPLLSTLVQLLRLLVIFASIAFVLGIWGVRLADMNRLLSYEIWSVSGRPVTLLRMIGAIVVVASGVFISRGIRAFLNTQVFPQMRHLDRGVQAAVSTLLNYTILGLAGFVALSVVQLDLGALTVLLGTLGLGLGLGLQPLLVNFLSGLMILFERHMRVGDVVEVSNQSGEVQSISMRSTRIRSADGIDIVVPNGEFINGKVMNWTLSDSRIRGQVDVGVAYGTDVQLVRKLLLDIAHRDENVLVDPLPQVWFMNFGENSLEFRLVCWFANPGARWNFMSQSRFEIDKVFRENGIEIPFPQRTLNFAPGQSLPVRMMDAPRLEPEPSSRPSAGEPAGAHSPDGD